MTRPSTDGIRTPSRSFPIESSICWESIGGGDMTGYGTRWVLADWEERLEIERIFRNYDLGWLYYIQTEGGSPNIGLPDDEFTDNNNVPYRLYVRQGRRIHGRYTLNESDIHKDLRGNGTARTSPFGIRGHWCLWD